MLRDNLVGLIEPMRISAGVDPLALSIQKQASDDRSSCLENPRPEGAESSLTETSPLHFRLSQHIPTLSWKGAYHLGSDDSVVPQPVVIAPSFAAVLAGNLTGNGSPVVHNTIGLFWCGQFSGTCAGLADAYQIPLIDLGFYYGPAILVPSLNGLWQPPPSVFYFTANFNWDGVILSQAIDGVRKAFLPFPALLVNVATTTASPPGMLSAIFGNQQPITAIEQDHVVFISGTLYLTRTGATNDGSSPSTVYYGSLLNGAQIDLNLVNQLPATDPSLGMTPAQSSAFQSFLVGIGKGIGNTAAHEIGHQFSLPYMDCDRPPNPNANPPVLAGRPCPTNAPQNNFYEYYIDTMIQFSVVGPPLQWTTEDATALGKLLLKK